MARDVTIELVNLKEVQVSIRNFGKDARGAIRKVIMETGVAMGTVAKGRLAGALDSARHWITGRLASSVHMEHNMPIENKNTFSPVTDSKAGDGNLNIQLEDMEAAVGTNVEYADKIEFDYDSYLRYAAEHTEPKFVKEAKEALNKLMEERVYE